MPSLQRLARVRAHTRAREANRRGARDAHSREGRGRRQVHQPVGARELRRRPGHPARVLQAVRQARSKAAGRRFFNRRVLRASPRGRYQAVGALPQQHRQIPHEERCRHRLVQSHRGAEPRGADVEGTAAQRVCVTPQRRCNARGGRTRCRKASPAEGATHLRKTARARGGARTEQRGAPHLLRRVDRRARHAAQGMAQCSSGGLVPDRAAAYPPGGPRPRVGRQERLARLHSREQLCPLLVARLRHHSAHAARALCAEAPVRQPAQPGREGPPAAQLRPGRGAQGGQRSFPLARARVLRLALPPVCRARELRRRLRGRRRIRPQRLARHRCLLPGGPCSLDARADDRWRQQVAARSRQRRRRPRGELAQEEGALLGSQPQPHQVDGQARGAAWSSRGTET
mmetsp:Transcript_44826/g.104720  ORF Transcript_44826/g.104720 Transcript_44826/m.104720 type:complete len:401 (-) Transcript_44826:847-2049(-)